MPRLWARMSRIHVCKTMGHEALLELTRITRQALDISLFEHEETES